MGGTYGYAMSCRHYLIRSDDNRRDAIMVLSRTHQAFRRFDFHVQLTLDHSQLPRYLKGIEV